VNRAEVDRHKTNLPNLPRHSRIQGPQISPRQATTRTRVRKQLTSRNPAKSKIPICRTRRTVGQNGQTKASSRVNRPHRLRNKSNPMSIETKWGEGATSQVGRPTQHHGRFRSTESRELLLNPR